MKKKVLSVLLVAAMTASMLAGCGAAKEEAAGTEEVKVEEEVQTAETEAPADEQQAEEAKNPVTLKTVSMFGGTDPNAPIYEEINKAFMEENSYITVEDNSQVSDEEWKATIAADFSVGNEPDVLQFFTDATANTIIATDKFVTVEEIKAEYPEYAKDTLDAALTAVTNTDGVSRAIPTTGYWEGLYCNKDLFDQYGVELPTDWESLTNAIAVFKENGIIPIACSLNNVPHYWIEFLMLYSAGEESYTSVPETAPAEWAAGLETFKTLRDMGAFPEDTDTVDDAYVGQLFKDKKAAMQLDGSWYLGGVTDVENTVVIPFPGVENQKAKAGALVGGMSSGFYITKKAWDDPDKRDAAVKFVMAHTNKDSVQKYWNGNGQAACAVEPIDGMSPLALSGLEYSSAASSICAPTDSRIDPEAYKIIVGGIVKVSTGELSAQDLLDEALSVNAARK
ncbi:MAG: extracellular solute-binding protein [Lachnospiraceae bacterium]|nr:extracellular solute-binding protein [Lachnospiraceae bacterium]MDD3659531.1 extracellular solute-binding protein [Lachnospiraceae bacterium]